MGYGMTCSHQHQRFSVQGCGATVAPERYGWRFIVALWNTLVLWDERERQRRALAQLDDHLLRDMGLDPHTVRTECYKPFWSR